MAWFSSFPDANMLYGEVTVRESDGEERTYSLDSMDYDEYKKQILDVADMDEVYYSGVMDGFIDWQDNALRPWYWVALKAFDMVSAEEREAFTVWCSDVMGTRCGDYSSPEALAEYFDKSFKGHYLSEEDYFRERVIIAFGIEPSSWIAETGSLSLPSILEDRFDWDSVVMDYFDEVSHFWVPTKGEAYGGYVYDLDV